ncbi:MAG: TonB family protein [Acidobacteria bacterium]|nr:MAG: TonB family protein [Acidobacteriota bacterium]REK10364.1 MAG: TonB family protein [Acidobacteriota bacterium]
MDAVTQLLDRRSLATPRLGRLFPVVSVLLHVALVVGAVLGPRLFERQRPEVRYVEVVTIPAADLQRGPRPEPRRTPPAPVPEPEPEPEVEAPKPAPEDVPVLQPEEPEPRRESPPEESPVSEEPEEPAPVEAPGTQETPPASTGRSQEADFAGFDDPEFSLRYSYYLDRLIARIRREWRRPPVGEGVELIISFRIVREGNQLTELQVAQSSGSRAFDRAAYEAVSRAVPLPPLPQAYRKDSLGVRIIFR